MKNRSESREKSAYRVQISLFEEKLPLICFNHCNNQPSQLFTCSPLCKCWLGNGRLNEIFFPPALWGTVGVHTLDRQTGRLAFSFQESREGLATVLWLRIQEHMWLKAWNIAPFGSQGRRGSWWGIWGKGQCQEFCSVQFKIISPLQHICVSMILKWTSSDWQVGSQSKLICISDNWKKCKRRKDPNF